ncbi:MAG: WD40 repeat domain-containing protein [Verrucomicrobiota bacterium]
MASLWDLGLVVAALFLFSALLARADDLIVSNQTPAFILDTRLPSTDPGPASLIVQFESPPFALDTRLPSGESPNGSLIVQAETPPFTLDTRLPDGVAPSSGTVVTESGSFILDTRLPDGVAPSSGTVVVESSRFTLDTRLPDGISFTNGVVIVASPPFTLDTRLPADTTPPAAMVVTAESPLFTLDTRLPGDTTPLPNLITQAETPTFTLDTRIALQDPLNTNLLGMAQSDPFTLDTLSGAYTTPAQTLSGGTTGGRARFSPDGLQLAKADGSRVLLWNLHSIRTNVTFTGHAGEVTTVEFSPLGDQLLTGSADGTFRWWDTASRNELGHTNPPGNGTVYAAYASDGARILAGRGANAALYRVPSIQIMREFPGSEGTISAVAVCPEGLAIAGNSYRSAILWDTATGVVRSHLTNHTRMITAAAFLPGGTNAMTASLDGTIRIWDTATGAERMVLQQGTPAVDASLSLDGTILVTCYDGNPLLRGNGPIGTAYIWDAQTGALMRVLSDETAPGPMKGVAISPDHTALATTYTDGSVRLWNTGLDPRPNYPVTTLPIGTNVPVTLRSHGLYYFAVDAQAARSLVITLEADPAGGAKLKGSADIPVGLGRALSTDAEFANLGASQADRNVGAPTGKSLESPPPGADLTAFRMTATRGKLPSQYDYELFAQAYVTNLHCEMPMVTTDAGKIYVLVFAPYLAAGSVNARIHVEYSDYHISSIWPPTAGNLGEATLKVQGVGFTPEVTPILASMSSSITGRIAKFKDSTFLYATFDLHGVPSQVFDLRIEKPGGVAVTKAGALTVTVGRGPMLSARIQGPENVRPGRDFTSYLEVQNEGDSDMVLPVFFLEFLNVQGVRLVPNGQDLGRRFTLVVPDQESLLPVYPPGMSVRLPIYLTAANTDNQVKLGVVDIGDPKLGRGAIDYSVLARPQDVSEEDWAIYLGSLSGHLGPTVSQFYLNTIQSLAAMPYAGYQSSLIVNIEGEWRLLGAPAGEPVPVHP